MNITLEFLNSLGFNYTKEDLPKIITLNLNYKNLRHIPQEGLKGLIGLVGLSFCCNMISDICNNTFEDLTNLKVLRLSNNWITKIEKDVFKGLDSLEELDLGNNPLKTIDKETFLNLKSLQVLILPKAITLTAEELGIPKCQIYYEGV